MLNLLINHAGTLLVGIVVLAVIAAIIFRQVAKRKRGAAAGCGCGCVDCPNSKGCTDDTQPQS